MKEACAGAAIPIYSIPLDVTNNPNAIISSQDRQTDHIRIHVQGSARTNKLWGDRTTSCQQCTLAMCAAVEKYNTS